MNTGRREDRDHAIMPRDKKQERKVESNSARRSKHFLCNKLCFFNVILSAPLLKAPLEIFLVKVPISESDVEIAPHPWHIIACLLCLNKSRLPRRAHIGLSCSPPQESMFYLCTLKQLTWCKFRKTRRITKRTNLKQINSPPSPVPQHQTEYASKPRCCSVLLTQWCPTCKGGLRKKFSKFKKANKPHSVHK